MDKILIDIVIKDHPNGIRFEIASRFNVEEAIGIAVRVVGIENVIGVVLL